MIALSARYRVFIHNPPDESASGGSYKIASMGTYRAGFREWRTNNLDAAIHAADRCLADKCRPGGWASVQEMDGLDKVATVYVTRDKVAG